MIKVAFLMLAIVLWLGTVKSCMRGNSLPKKGDSKRIESYTAQLSEFIQLDEHVNMSAVVSKYLNYGCFCGWGGVGNTPVDESDACCQNHDDCYNKIETNGKINLDPPFLNALAQVSNKVKNLALIILTYQYDYDWKTRKATCSEGQSATKLAKCKCDYALGYCLSANLNTYNPKYNFMDKNPQVCPTKKND